MANTKVAEAYCTRFGDAGEYTMHDELEDAAKCATALGITTINVWCNSGFWCSRFTDRNYVSLFVADSGMNMIRNLTPEEQEKFEALLRLEE